MLVREVTSLRGPSRNKQKRYLEITFMKKTTLILAVALSAAAATSAQKTLQTPGVYQDSISSAPNGQTIIVGTVVETNTFNGTTDTVVSVAGEQSWDLLGDSSNTILSIDLGAGTKVTGLGWDVTHVTQGGSWCNEARFTITDSAFGQGVFLTPSGTGSPGTETNSSPVLLFSDLGIPNIVLADGTCLIELNETFDDVADAVDCDWTAGTLTLQNTGGGGGGVPTVGQWGLILLTTLLFAGVVVRSVSTRKTAPTVG